MAEEAAGQVADEHEFRRILAGLPDFAGLPIAVVHGELGQAVQLESGDLVLVDWDEAGLGPALIDVAGRLIHDLIGYDLVIRERSLLSFYGGYFGPRVPSHIEMDLLFPLAALYALAYCRFADAEQRFARVRFAISARLTLLGLVQESLDAQGPGCLEPRAAPGADKDPTTKNHELLLT